MKPLGLGKYIEAKAQEADVTPQEWLTGYINEWGSIKRAAKELKVSRQALSNMCGRLGISVTGVKREFSVKPE